MLGRKIDVDKFNREFNKRFANFCMKAPLSLSYALSGDKLKLYKEPDDSLLLEFPFDYSKSVKENIFRIRESLVQFHYPRFIISKQTEVQPDTGTLASKYESGEISVDELLNYKEFKVTETEYIIERVIYMRDELFIRNESTDTLERYKMKMPVTYFLKGLIQGEYDSPGEFFLKKSRKL